ncbi:type VI secretion system tube protein TssD [Porphyromonas macacae]|uniref:type VI secretion system tube protein TssD n=1 Tax=Porphyromonas macacae TaxID=28115 RepID=UPI00359F4429
MAMDFNLSQPDGNVSAVLVLMGKEYDVCQFNTSFMQETDEKGEPQSEVHGGCLLVVLSQVPDNALLQWASSQWQRKDGEIVFRNETGTPPLRIAFTEAYCVGLQQETAIDRGARTALTISPRSVRLNEFTMENSWTD